MEISWGKDEQCPAVTAPNTVSSLDRISGVVLTRHTHPGRASLLRGSLTFGTAVRLRLPSHTASRRKTSGCHLASLSSRAVAFDSRLPPTGPAGDFHPQSPTHAQRTSAPLRSPQLAWEHVKDLT